MKSKIRITSILLIIFLVIELILETNIQAEKITLKNNYRQISLVDKNIDSDYKTKREAIANAQPDITVYVKKENITRLMK